MRLYKKERGLLLKLVYLGISFRYIDEPRDVGDGGLQYFDPLLLAQKFGDKANYGRNSLIAAVQDKLNDTSINWQNIFADPAYGLYEENSSFEEFADKVIGNDLDACEKAARICRDKGWALFATVDMFEAWLKDVIESNLG